MTTSGLNAALVGIFVFIAPMASAVGDTNPGVPRARGALAVEELAAAHDIATPPVQFVTATDGVSLAYYPFRAQTPLAKLIFYHGGGAHSLAGYQQLADALSRRHRISTYLIDIRGHGKSGGERGDTPSPEQAWQDVATVVSALRAETPAVPLFLGGHSSGAGLVLNYLDHARTDGFAGFVFIAPQFGYRANVMRKSDKQFVKVSYPSFIINRITGGLVCGHCKAVRFDYPEDAISKAGLLPWYTVNMSKAVTPSAPAEEIGRLKGRLGLWVGKEDQLFDAAKLKEFTDSAHSAALALDFYTVPLANHLSILLSVDTAVGAWIGDIVDSTRAPPR